MKELMFLTVDYVDCIADCGGADILRIIKFVFKLLDLALFIIPIGLIVMIMVDFSKNVIAGKEDEMKKNVSIVIKRIIYCVALFLVPTIVNTAIGLVGNAGVSAVNKAAGCIEYAKSGDLSACEIDYDSDNKGGSTGVGVTTFRCWKCNDEYVWGNDSNAINCDLIERYTDKKTCENNNNASTGVGVTTFRCWKCDGEYVWGNDSNAMNCDLIERYTDKKTCENNNK